MRLIRLLTYLAVTALFLPGCKDGGQVTVLFTGDVKGHIRPAG